MAHPTRRKTWMMDSKAMPKNNKTIIEALVLGIPAAVFAARGIAAFVSQDSWNAPKYGRPIHYLDRAAQMHGMIYISLAAFLAGAWIYFSLKRSSVGAALMVSSLLTATLSFVALLRA